MSFAGQVSAFKRDSLEYFRNVKRGACFDLFAAIVQETPVDQGVLKGSWWPSISIPETRSLSDAEPDASGQYTIEQIEQLCGRIELEEVVFMVNRQPYAARIEYDGHSGKAPDGMVRVNAARWTAIVTNVARSLAS